jgi:signal transduction histidine kinase
VAIQHAHLFEQVKSGRTRLQALSRRLLEVQESERRYIARELHDEVGQGLTAAKINLQAAGRQTQIADVKAYLEESIGIIDRTLQQVRNLSLALRPAMLDDLGLVSALRWYLERQARRSETKVTFTSDPIEPRLSQELETVLFRIVQEGITNVLRHARAEHATVELRLREKELELTIRDDGLGFDLEAARQRASNGESLGLLGMQERVELAGGHLTVQTAPMFGTQIKARFPSLEGGKPT